jgi:hypothetical protein
MPDRPALRRLHHRWSGALHRLALAARRLALRTQAGPARPLWRAVYELLARGIGSLLAAGQPDASVYVAASLADGEPVYGLSDIDLVVVAADVDAVRRRWRRLGRLLPPVGALIADLGTYTAAELVDAAAASTLLDPGRPVYLGHRANRDDRGLRERPGLAGPSIDWRRLSGPEQRPALPATDAQRLRIATWLELQFWWRQAMAVAANEIDDRTAYTCLKLVSNGARAWLALELGSAPPSGDAAVAAAAARLPDEEPSLRRALTLRACLGASPEAAVLDESLAVFARLSHRVAAQLQAVADAAGTIEVHLSGTPSPSAATLPLVDWRAVVLPMLPDETLVPMAGHPGERSAVAAAVHAAGVRRYGAVRSGDLLVLGAGEHWTRSFLRAAACPVTDPVSFALLNGRHVARFPRLVGWSVADMTARAVTEHRAWLAQAPEDATLSDRQWLDGRMAAAAAPKRIAAKLLTSARAALLHDSLADGSPQLAIGLEAIAAGLGERYPHTQAAMQAVAGAYVAGDVPERTALRTLRANLRRLAVYAAPVPAAAGDAVPV